MIIQCTKGSDPIVLLKGYFYLSSKYWADTMSPFKIVVVHESFHSIEMQEIRHVLTDSKRRCPVIAVGLTTSWKEYAVFCIG